MSTVTVKYNEEIYIINRSNINYIHIKQDYISKGILLIITLNNGSITLRFKNLDSGLFLANKIMCDEDDSTYEITV